MSYLIRRRDQATTFAYPVVHAGDMTYVEFVDGAARLAGDDPRIAAFRGNPIYRITSTTQE